MSKNSTTSRPGRGIGLALMLLAIAGFVAILSDEIAIAIGIIVGGGAGRHSIYIPTFAASISITREITN